MSTRSEIIRIGDELIRDKGYNAFSFYDIAKALGIKNASIHYHFPTKVALGIAVLDEQMAALEALIEKGVQKEPLDKLKDFFSIYIKIEAEGKICIVGSLASDLHTLDVLLAAKLKEFANRTLEWVTDIVKEGHEKGVFRLSSTPRDKALMIITNMLASLQLTRLTGGQDFNTIKDTIIKELKA